MLQFGEADLRQALQILCSQFMSMVQEASLGILMEQEIEGYLVLILLKSTLSKMSLI